MTDVRVVSLRQMVTIWPEEMLREDPSGDAASFCVCVERRPDGMWVLAQGLGEGTSRFLTVGGWDFPWQHQPLLLDHEQALALAIDWAPRVTVMGITAQECLDWHLAGCPRDEKQQIVLPGTGERA